MKTLLLTFLLFIVFIPVKSQLIEFGGGLGSFGYFGDLGKGFSLHAQRPNLSAHYRLNFSPFVSTRWNLSYGILAGSDQKPSDTFAALRKTSFSAQIAELAYTLEYHFLDYKQEKSTVRWSPYVQFGFAVLRVYGDIPFDQNINKFQIAIPFGIGFKHLIGKRFSVNTEFGVRALFTDRIDRTSDGDQQLKNFDFGNPNDTDRYFYSSISLSYILYKIPCPFPYKPNRYMKRANFR